MKRDKSTQTAQTILWEKHIPSCECKKVVSDILGEIEYFGDKESTFKKTHFES